MGEPRRNFREQVRYLSRIGRDFSDLAHQSITGLYTNMWYFDSIATPDGGSRRLRAQVRKTWESFEEQMRQHGKTNIIVEEKADSDSSRFVKRSHFVEQVKEWITDGRGLELPGIWNPGIIEDLFRVQCKPWPRIIEATIEDLKTLVRDNIRQILDFTVLPDNIPSVNSHIIEPALKSIFDNLDAKVEELLETYRHMHPITYNTTLVDSVKHTQRQRRERRVASIIQNHMSQATRSYYGETTRLYTEDAIQEAVKDSIEPDMETAAATTAIDFMEAYYKVSDLCTMQARETNIKRHACADRMEQYRRWCRQAGSRELPAQKDTRDIHGGYRVRVARRRGAQAGTRE